MVAALGISIYHERTGHYTTRQYQSSQTHGEKPVEGVLQMLMRTDGLDGPELESKLAR